jgi:hypothetical protein
MLRLLFMELFNWKKLSHLLIIKLNSTSSISGNAFPRDAKNKVTITTQRQKIATISEMIRNILNMINHQAISKNNP